MSAAAFLTAWVRLDAETLPPQAPVEEPRVGTHLGVVCTAVDIETLMPVQRIPFGGWGWGVFSTVLN